MYVRTYYPNNIRTCSNCMYWTISLCTCELRLRGNANNKPDGLLFYFHRKKDALVGLEPTTYFQGSCSATFTHIQRFLHAHIYCTNTHTLTYTYVHAHTHARTHAHTHTHTYKLTSIHVCIHPPSLAARANSTTAAL